MSLTLRIETSRLVLRPLKIEDKFSIAALRSNDLVNQYLDRPRATTVDDAVKFIYKIQQATADGQSFYWAITLTNDDTLIGAVCLWNISEDLLTIEVGFELHPDFQGKGLMQEALTAVIDNCFNPLGFSTITACTHPKNSGSIKLLEKCGFKEGLPPSITPDTDSTVGLVVFSCVKV
ncbi:MAG: GNAT family N-acetyltransferase [Mucilaginibacter sp.]